MPTLPCRGKGFRVFPGFVRVSAEDDQILFFPAPSPDPVESVTREKGATLREPGGGKPGCELLLVVKTASSRERLGTPFPNGRFSAADPGRAAKSLRYRVLAGNFHSEAQETRTGRIESYAEQGLDATGPDG